MTKSFRLPRKTKKQLTKTLWLYPLEENGYLMAQPAHNQEDYAAYKKGIVKNILQREPKEDPKTNLDTPVTISGSELKKMIEDIIHPDFQVSSYQKLLDASKKPDTAVAYYNFINAYRLVQQGDSSYGNVCCLAVDYARKLLKEKRSGKS